MKIPPKKPHFFKPILPGFKNGLKIPIGFLKYLKGHDHIDHAILRRAGKKWLVKVNGRRLEEGNWKEFVEQHDLQLGNLLIFRHEGDMQFDVSIFDSSHCDREYVEYLHEDEEEDEDEDEDEEVATHDKPSGQSHFECVIRKYCLSRGFMFLPQQFALANGLTNKKCGLILRDERQRSWNLKLSSNNTRAYIGDGWRKFVAENFLKEGDRIMFDIVTNGETPIWKFRIVTDGESPIRKFQEKMNPNIKLSNKSCSYAEAATDQKPCHVQSHFECTIRQYCLSRGLLYVPKQFAFANGLIDKKCNLIIRDEKQRSWNLKFCYWGTEVYIRDGWRKFVVDNCLKRGDQITFEVITNGETPIWELQVVTNGETPSMQKFQDIMKKPSNISPLNAQVSTSTSSDGDHPYFVSTIKPYCISKSYLYLPLDFAKSNGLMNRKCEMILKDEAQRCWSVCLGRCSHHFGIINGWTKFRAANRLQVGDAYKFELIKNGKIPIAQFHCKFSGKGCKERGKLTQ